MAFPTSPTNGQIHNTYSWNSSKSAWELFIDSTEPFPIGSFFVQYPDAASNTDSIAFPVDKRPAALYGGTWSEVFSTEGIFFRTRGDGGRVDVTGGRSNGLQLDQMQRITGGTAIGIHTGFFPGIIDSASGAFSRGAADRTRVPDDVAGTGHTLNFSSADSPNARASVNTAGETRSANRLIKVWKRIA